MQNEWTYLLIDVAIAKNYKTIACNQASLAIAEVDSVIVSGLMIRAVSILDLALDEYITGNNIEYKTKLRKPRLYDRLKILEDNGLLLNYKDIDGWRLRRNDIGHSINENYTWEELDLCLNSIFIELSNLQILANHPTLTIKKTIKRVTPTAQDIAIEQDVTVDILEGDTIYHSFGWKVRV